MDVGDFLRELGLQQYEAAFRDNRIDVRVLPKLTAEDLKELGVTTVGDRRLLLEAIAALRKPAAPAGTSGTDATNDGSKHSVKAPLTAEAERRPLSVMFCDLIGSTALSARLDPEDLREVIRGYQACVAATIQQFNGYIARYVGDGVLIYFGWPEAHETDTERAVRAGLAVAAAVSETQVGGESLQVRIGVATGLVVIGEPIGSGDSRQQTAVGETPNLAARLQSLAGPGQVVIDAATRRQIGALFECQDLGQVELGGLPRPVRAWNILGESAVESRFEALRATGLTPLIGRAEELELLSRHWQRAQGGEGQAVLLSGEAGIGKSRLTAGLYERIRDEPHLWISWFCSPHHQDSALHPIIAGFERAAGFQRADTDEAKWTKLEALLTATSLADGDVALIGDLLSLSGRNLLKLADMSAEQRRRRTTEALLRYLIGLARQRPTVMVFEDIHWADPSSRDMLDRLIDEIADQAVLLVLVFRAEFSAPWAGLAHVTSLLLNRLDRRESMALVRVVASPDRQLPADLVDEIVGRTDGVPLFVEELTRAALEAGVIPGSIPAVVASVPPVSSAVPASLHASLMARLDRLGPDAREVAQIGAVISREFEYELLAAVAERGETGLQGALELLTRAGLVSRRGMLPTASFVFKHALVQDVAYGSLLRARRQHLHAAIARALVDQFPEQRENQPELVAHHFTEAGQAARRLASSCGGWTCS